MLLPRMHNFLEKIAAHVISSGMAMRCPFLTQSAHRNFKPEIAFEDILHGLPDMQWMELHMRTAFRER